jgi:DNA-binding HxlR family transcriptional regulator
VPPKVEYSLTDIGEQLNEALLPLGIWGRERIARSNLPITPTASTPS